MRRKLNIYISLISHFHCIDHTAETAQELKDGGEYAAHAKYGEAERKSQGSAGEDTSYCGQVAGRRRSGQTFQSG